MLDFYLLVPGHLLAWETVSDAVVCLCVVVQAAEVHHPSAQHNVDVIGGSSYLLQKVLRCFLRLVR